ncbi:hybrid sensor histidine kinase/response regulator [Pedobacter antarcticus]|uniref:hybrid sensor histidine kinase/response regulator n=1 Tax=Pedobacter antarcticus TaxID=34086 RepID=UPI000887225D|nr:ATP-binding protein [Pedobacter antarcticus]SDM13539.1 Signal transduction histidine kinase [Pedobacter antarcticus]
MTDVTRKSFLSAAKGKIIVGFLLAFCALFLAWGVSKVAFDEMLDTVNSISAPNDKLRLVNMVSRKVSSLDQQQKNLAFSSPGKYNQFFKESRQLRVLLDSLSGMYKNDSVQLSRIKSIEGLLVIRDRQFVNYLKVREGLVNNQSFRNEVQKLNQLVNKGPGPQDSTVVTTEKKTSTVTIFPVDEVKKKGLFNRIFGKKKEEENTSYQVTNEEKIQRDTISLSADTVIARGLEKSLRTIAEEQKIKSARFLDREAVLAEANNKLINQMLDILRKVEGEVVIQIEQNGIRAKEVVNTGISRISFIMIGFFLLTVILLYLILTDITRSNLYRKELEEARDEAEFHSMAKQRFLSNMSHEIRTPLQSIIGYAEIIRNQPNPQLRDINAIYSSSEHLLQIVNEILDYNRIISGKFTFSSKTFRLADLLEDVILVMKPQAEQKKLIMRTDVDLSGSGIVMGDPFRLKQILYNLLSNAIKFTPHGEILLRAEDKRQGGQLHMIFTITDTGIGMTEEQSNRIFIEFEQIDSPDKEVTNKAGAGLGLNIVRSLVENQGGRIYVKSKPGEGSTFTVYLTMEVGEETDLPKNTPELQGPVVQGRVWVVDDDSLILDLCEVIFKRRNIAYRCFNSPVDMLSAPWDNEVSYILMDIRMPGISGRELCQQMRRKIPADVKIFAMTAQVLPEELESVLAQGFDGLLMKPFRETDLLGVFRVPGSVAIPVTQKIITQPTITTSVVDFDTSVIEKMTFGDNDLLLKILNRFRDDCEQDSMTLLEALKKTEFEEARLIVHRIAGRTAQMGASTLAAEFRLMEISLDRAGTITVEDANTTRLMVTELNALIELVDQKIANLQQQ